MWQPGLLLCFKRTTSSSVDLHIGTSSKLSTQPRHKGEESALNIIKMVVNVLRKTGDGAKGRDTDVMEPLKEVRKGYELPQRRVMPNCTNFMSVFHA